VAGLRGKEGNQCSDQTHTSFVHCVGLIDGMLFPLALQLLRTQRKISQGKVTMQLKVDLFVMIQQRLPGLRRDGPAAYMTIGFGPTVMYMT